MARELEQEQEQEQEREQERDLEQEQEQERDLEQEQERELEREQERELEREQEQLKRKYGYQRNGLTRRSRPSPPPDTRAAISASQDGGEGKVVQTHRNPNPNQPLPSRKRN